MFKILAYSVIPWAVSVITYWVACTPFYFLDKYYEKNKTLSQVKTQPDYIDNKMNKINWKKYKSAAFVSLFNDVCISFPLSFLSVPLCTWLDIKYIMLPNLVTLIRDMISILILVDISFYYIHRLLHVGPFYKYIHQFHHKWMHPVAVSAKYVHPIEFFLTYHLPFIIALIFAKPHIMSLILCVFIGSINIVKAHSGYNFSWFSAEDHDLHHKFKNVNFGFLLLLDNLHGTAA